MQIVLISLISGEKVKEKKNIIQICSGKNSLVFKALFFPFWRDILQRCFWRQTDLIMMLMTMKRLLGDTKE